MSNTESNPDYPRRPVNLFDTPIEYEELPEQSPTTPTTPIQPLDTLLPLDTGKKKMSPEGSSSTNPFSFSTRVDKKTPVNVKLDSTGKLTGQEDYRIWSASVTKILKGIKAYKVVVDGIVPAEGADATQVDAYDLFCHTVSTIFIQLVSQDIFQKIVDLEKPNLMWTCLRTEYYRDSAYGLVSQIMNLSPFLPSTPAIPCQNLYPNLSPTSSALQNSREGPRTHTERLSRPSYRRIRQNEIF